MINFFTKGLSPFRKPQREISPLQGLHGTPPPSALQKNNVPASRSSGLHAVATPLEAQQSSLDVFSSSSSVQRPWRTIVAQHIPPGQTVGQLVDCGLKQVNGGSRPRRLSLLLLGSSLFQQRTPPVRDHYTEKLLNSSLIQQRRC